MMSPPNSLLLSAGTCVAGWDAAAGESFFRCTPRETWMHEATALGELTFHVIVVLLIRVHAVVPVKRLEQEMSEVAVMEGRSFIRKLFLLAGGENRLAGRASLVKELQGRLVASQPKGANQ
jgi:hypothetical protein